MNFAGMPLWVGTSSAAPVINRSRTVQSMALPPNAIVAAFKTRWRGAIRVSTMELLHSILRRVRQRAFVVLDPHEIARVDKAAANLTSEIMLSLTDAPPISALADAGSAQSRFVDRHDRCRCESVNLIAACALKNLD